MITVIKEKNSNRFFGKQYIKIERYGCSETVISTVRIKSVSLKKDNYIYMFLSSFNKVEFYECFYYLNYEIKGASFKDREGALSALKIFFQFIELFNVDYRNIRKKDLLRLKIFLRGGYYDGNDMKLEIRTRRSYKTINKYFCVYRQFLVYVEAKVNLFTVESKKLNFAEDKNYNTKIYENNNKVIQQNLLPDYISVSKYIEILNYIRSKENRFKLRNEIMIRLEFECGLRVSEVRGITLEDVYTDKHIENKFVMGIIELRNRISDKQYQLCKGCRRVTSKDDYNTKEYNTLNDGFQQVAVPMGIINLINEYVAEIRGAKNTTKITRMNMRNTKADKVLSRSNIADNYYIFLSKNYTPITVSGWNNIIRDIYSNVGIELDKECRKTNLNHKLRHGYAMMLKNLCGYSAIDLKLALRHRSIQSSLVYTNPSLADLLKKNKESMDILYSRFPELLIKQGEGDKIGQDNI